MSPLYRVKSVSLACALAAKIALLRLVQFQSLAGPRSLEALQEIRDITRQGSQ